MWQSLCNNYFHLWRGSVWPVSLARQTASWQSDTWEEKNWIYAKSLPTTKLLWTFWSNFLLAVNEKKKETKYRLNSVGDGETEAAKSNRAGFGVMRRDFEAFKPVLYVDALRGFERAWEKGRDIKWKGRGAIEENYLIQAMNHKNKESTQTRRPGWWWGKKLDLSQKR